CSRSRGWCSWRSPCARSERAREPPLLVERARRGVPRGAHRAPRPRLPGRRPHAADHDARHLRARALQQAGQRAVGGARPERGRRRAAPGGRGAGHGLLPPAAQGRELRPGARSPAPRPGARGPRRPGGLRARRRARAAARAAPARRERSALRRPDRRLRGGGGGRVRDPDRPRERAARRAPPAGPDRRAAALLVQPDAQRPRLLPGRVRRHAAHEPLPLGHLGRPGRRARDGHLRTDAGAAHHPARDRAREARPLRRRLLRAAPLRRPLERARLRHLAAGELAQTTAQSVFITVFFIMPSFVLSGVMYPYQFMPRGVREVGGLFPLRWYQIALRRIVERGAGFAEVLGPGLALAGLFALLLLVVRWRMKPRLG